MTIAAKTFQDVQIGDKAYHVENRELEGEITWKGSLRELNNFNDTYKQLLLDLEDDWRDLEDDYPEWVIIQTHPEGPILFNYNSDPSGVFVINDSKAEIATVKLEWKFTEKGLTRAAELQDLSRKMAPVIRDKFEDSNFHNDEDYYLYKLGIADNNRLSGLRDIIELEDIGLLFVHGYITLADDQD